MIIGGKVLPRQDMINIVEGARMLKTMPIWDAVIKSTQYEANKRITTDSADWDDVYFGKAALWVIDIQRIKIEKLSNPDKLGLK